MKSKITLLGLLILGTATISYAQDDIYNRPEKAIVKTFGNSSNTSSQDKMYSNNNNNYNNNYNSGYANRLNRMYYNPYQPSFSMGFNNFYNYPYMGYYNPYYGPGSSFSFSFGIGNGYYNPYNPWYGGYGCNAWAYNSWGNPYYNSWGYMPYYPPAYGYGSSYYRPSNRPNRTPNYRQEVQRPRGYGKYNNSRYNNSSPRQSRESFGNENYRPASTPSRSGTFSSPSRNTSRPSGGVRGGNRGRTGRF